MNGEQLLGTVEIEDSDGRDYGEFEEDDEYRQHMQDAMEDMSS